MKRTTLTLAALLCCLLMAAPAGAQMLQFGVKAGMNMTRIDWGDGWDENMTGIFIGPTAELTIPIVGLGVEASALLSQKGFNADSDHSKQLGLDVPVSLKYTFGLGKTLGIYLAAGPDFYFDFKGEKNGVERKRAQVGINVGGGVKLFRHLQVGVNYNIPTGDHFSLEGAGSAIVKGKDKTWQVSLAYMF